VRVPQPHVLLAAADPTWFEWWSDLILPTVVGVGSLATAVVAVFVAARSNRFARAATKAAHRSNVIANRANQLEEDRDRREAESRALAERELFASRWATIIRQMTDEMQAGSEYYLDGLPSLAEGGRLIMEGEVRGFAFPGDAVTQLLIRADESELGRTLLDQASAAAVALAFDWARNPNAVAESVRTTNSWLDDRMIEARRDAAGDASRDA
jgi:hypothetical protein